ncbi:30S ribosomal protein S18 [Candidatus Kaiserbacteria bacterium]|nr:MAG: 30S ribosomal protein S18 [Candidatus Kaiserbacteria bacterium]PCI89801.1 MAG: 30S ribosomal protein S18 [Candidatus Kaiserbacteria bacterium]
MTADYFSQNGIKYIDYKDVDVLKRFLNPHGRIKARSQTGLNAKHQRDITRAIKRAREMALLAYIMK